MEQQTASPRERERWFRTLADSIPQMVWMTNELGVVEWFNQRWYDYTGMTPEQASGDGWRSVQHPDHLPRLERAVKQAFAEGKPWEEMLLIRGRDGTYRWFLSRAVPVRGPDGRIVRWFGTNTDLTAQRFLDAAATVLASSLDYTITLRQLASLAVPQLADWCVIDLVPQEGGPPRHVVVAHEDPDRSAVGRQWIDEHPDAPVAARRVIETNQAEVAASVTEEHLLAQGLSPEQAAVVRAFGIHSYVTAPMPARDRVLGAITLAVGGARPPYDAADIAVVTELGRRAGIAIENALLYQAAQYAVRAREDILAIVSHDLRNPLGAIDLSATMLLQTHGDDDRSRRQLEIVRRSVSRMQHLISDLLQMASIQSGKLALTRGRHDTARLLADIREVQQPLVSQHGMALTWEPDPDELGGITLDCDRERIIQVFANLIGNAVKFGAHGAAITIRVEPAPEHVAFTVADMGPGISPDELAHIFDPYWSAKRGSRKAGTGLGLYICKGIIDSHGGRIWAESTEHEGSRFSFTVPVAR